MQHLYYELSVLARAVPHKNLSAASMNIGLSQPQLSRIVARIEQELRFVLLDRTAKRKSGWTRQAHELADIFRQIERNLELRIQGLVKEATTSSLAIGTLEGMAPIALKLAKKAFDQLSIQTISIDVFDLGDLDEKFLAGDLDLIFSLRLPGRQKLRNVRQIGFQALSRVQSSAGTVVFSHFEYLHQARGKKTSQGNVLLSNSLEVRRSWLETHGGTGLLPARQLSATRPKDAFEVLAIGSELMSPALWQGLVKLL